MGFFDKKDKDNDATRMHKNYEGIRDGSLNIKDVVDREAVDFLWLMSGMVGEESRTAHSDAENTILDTLNSYKNAKNVTQEDIYLGMLNMISMSYDIRMTIREDENTLKFPAMATCIDHLEELFNIATRRIHPRDEWSTFPDMLIKESYKKPEVKAKVLEKSKDGKYPTEEELKYFLDILLAYRMMARAFDKLDPNKVSADDLFATYINQNFIDLAFDKKTGLFVGVNGVCAEINPNEELTKYIDEIRALPKLKEIRVTKEHMEAGLTELYAALERSKTEGAGENLSKDAEKRIKQEIRRLEKELKKFKD